MNGNISVMPVLGIDVGGTKTVCLLADDDERVIAEAREEGANLQGAGELALEKVLHSVMEKTLEGTGVIPSAICLGIAGVDRASDEAVVRSIMNRIGYKARILVVNDALIALQAGVGNGAGIVIVSGTGSIAYGRNDQGEASRAGGWGYVLGDEGSGYWIGRLALRAVVRHADGRGRVTSLTPRLLAHFGVTRATELIHKIYHEELGPRSIAAVAKYVQHARDEGDTVATGILNRAADELDDGGNGGDDTAGARPSETSHSCSPAACFTPCRGCAIRCSCSAGARAAEQGDAPRSGARARRRAARAGRTARRREVAGLPAQPHMNLRVFQTAEEAAHAAAAAVAAQLAAQTCVGAGAADRTHVARRVRRARTAARIGRRRFFAGAHVQPRRVRRTAVERQAQLLRVHAEAPLHAHQSSRQPHPFSERRRARSRGRMRQVRARDRRARRDGSAAARHRRATRTSASTSPARALHARSHRTRLALATRRANASLFGGRLDRVPREALTMGIGTMLDARAIVLIATGREKARAIELDVRGAHLDRAARVGAAAASERRSDSGFTGGREASAVGVRRATVTAPSRASRRSAA